MSFVICTFVSVVTERQAESLCQPWSCPFQHQTSLSHSVHRFTKPRSRNRIFSPFSPFNPGPSSQMVLKVQGQITSIKLQRFPWHFCPPNLLFPFPGLVIGNPMEISIYLYLYNLIRACSLSVRAADLVKIIEMLGWKDLRGPFLTTCLDHHWLTKLCS